MKIKAAVRVWAALVASVLFTASVYAQDTPAAPKVLLLELNKVDMTDGNCYFSFFIYNGTATPLKTISYTMSIVDQNGQMVTTYLFPVLPMALKQTRVKTVALPVACNDVSGLVPETSECTDASGAPLTICDEALFRSKVATIQFPWQPQFDPSN